MFEVWEENADAVRMFITCCTQWRASSGGLIGLDYSVLFRIMELYNIPNIKDCFEGVQVMEAAALNKINEEKD